MSGMTIKQALAVIQTEVNWHAGSDTHYRAERLEQSLTTLRAEIERLREVLKDTDNELDWLDKDMDKCDHSVGVCMCSYWYMRRKMKTELAKENINVHCESRATAHASDATNVVAWARPVYAKPVGAPEAVEGEVVDIEFHNRPEKPEGEGEGWRPLVFAAPLPSPPSRR